MPVSHTPQYPAEHLNYHEIGEVWKNRHRNSKKTKFIKVKRINFKRQSGLLLTRHAARSRGGWRFQILDGRHPGERKLLKIFIVIIILHSILNIFDSLVHKRHLTSLVSFSSCVCYHSLSFCIEWFCFVLIFVFLAFYISFQIKFCSDITLVSCRLGRT